MCPECRGRGVTVTAAQPYGIVIERAREFVKVGREHGYRLDELVELVATIGPSAAG